MDAGDLVPDEVTNAMVRDRWHRTTPRQGSCSTDSRRNIAQAYELDSMLGDLGRPSMSCSTSRSTTRKWCAACPGGVCARSAATCGTSSSTRRSRGRAATSAAASSTTATTTTPRPSGTAWTSTCRRPGADRVLRPAQAVVGMDAHGPVEDVTERAIESLAAFAG